MKRAKPESAEQSQTPVPASGSPGDPQAIIEAALARLDNPRLSWDLDLKPGVELPLLKRKIAEVVYELLEIDHSLRDDLAERPRHARYMRGLERCNFLAEENPALWKDVQEEIKLQEFKAQGFKAHYGSERSWKKYLYD